MKYEVQDMKVTIYDSLNHRSHSFYQEGFSRIKAMALAANPTEEAKKMIACKAVVIPVLQTTDNDSGPLTCQIMKNLVFNTMLEQDFKVKTLQIRQEMFWELRHMCIQFF